MSDDRVLADNSVAPDDKDWTWVLTRPCDECGFDARSFDVGDVGAMIRANADRWHGLLVSGAPSVTDRARPDRWSTLEYAAHVRDVHRLYERRLRLMLDSDDPLFPNWDQNSTAISERYGEQDPARVAEELLVAASVVATSFDSVSGVDWQRPGRRSDGASFTVESFARYMVHDPIHHMWDVAGR